MKKIPLKGILKKAFTSVLVVGVMAYTMASLTACNKDIGDFAKLKFNYIVIEENGESVLHEVKKWSDDESDSVTVTTSCCDNYIWTSANRSTLYKNKPDAKAYDRVCGHCAEEASANEDATENN